MMPEKLQDALNFLDDDLIKETEILRNKKAIHRKIIFRRILIAACVCAITVCLIPVAYLLTHSDNESVNRDGAGEAISTDVSQEWNESSIETANESLECDTEIMPPPPTQIYFVKIKATHQNGNIIHGIVIDQMNCNFLKNGDDISVNIFGADLAVDISHQQNIIVKFARYKTENGITDIHAIELQ